MLTTSCDRITSREVPSVSSAEPKPKLSNVDVAIASPGSLEQDIQFVGTTAPVREVSLKSRIEGEILDIVVDVGDRVERGQVLARIDDSLNQATVLEAEAELEALRSDVTSLQADVNEGITQIEQAKVTLKQAQLDLVRSQPLLREGAVTQQSAEQAQNAVDNAQQALQAAQQEVQNRDSAVVAARRRVAAQSALVAQAKKRKSFTAMTAPITGSVLERVLEPGDFAQVGDEVLQLGDFSQVEVQVQISELELGKIRVGQKAQVQLDALPDQKLIGKVTQISLAADATSRLIPVEVTIPNFNRRIGSGLLARVDFNPQSQPIIVIPETAIEVAANKAQKISTDSSNQATIFIIQGEGEQTTVTAREVEIGDRADSQIEILSGLEANEKFVVRSSGDLKEGDRVNLSFLSESLSP